MILTSAGLSNGWFDEKYGAHGNSVSIPFAVAQAPEGARSFALLFEDRDAFPVTGGFSWIHWVACNITTPGLPENASAENADIVQGLNSYISPQGGNLSREVCACYCGMSPPNEDHLYTLRVFALDGLLELENGFEPHRMFRLMQGHVLDSAELSGWYKKS